MDKLYTTGEIASKLGCTRAWIHRLAERDTIHHIKAGRIYLMTLADAKRGLAASPGRGRPKNAGGKFPEKRENRLD